MRVGDVSRPRRLADPARLRWYAYHRAVRFARRVLGSGAFSLPHRGPSGKPQG
jgi:hypothetical protein